MAHPLLVSSRWRLLVLSLLALTLAGGCASSRPVPRSPSSWAFAPQSFNDAEMRRGASKDVQVLPPVIPICTEQRVDRARLEIRLDVGEDDGHGTAVPFHAAVSVRITSPRGFDSGPLALSIDQDAPEQLRVVEVPADALPDHFTVRVLPGYTRDAVVAGDVRVVASYAHDLRVDARALGTPERPFVTVERIGDSNANPQTFRWSSRCPDIPRYQLQLLRLFNEDPAASSERQVRARIDWSRALTVETTGPEPELTLTVAEGTGYYVWRVRPIGSFYEGGVASAANWGAWSVAPADGTTVELDRSLGVLRAWPEYLLFYRQFDDDRNWIYTRTFSEDGDIAERMTYANGLQLTRQEQRRSGSDDRILVSSTLHDFAGRPALHSLSAPVTQEGLGYVERFMQHGGALYSAAHFDDAATQRDPLPVDGGALATYYSAAGPDPAVPSAEGYPFSRTRYHRDGLRRDREVGGAGSAHRIRPDFENSHTVRTYFAGVSDQELVRLFGDEAPRASSVSKTVTVDPNHTVRVTYRTAEGVTLATALASGPNTDRVDPLPSRGGSLTRITELVEGDLSCGDGCLESTRRLAPFVNPTDLTLDYRITPNSLADTCFGEPCRTCGYRVTFIVSRIDEDDPEFPKVETLAVPPGACGEAGVTWSKTYTLPPGSYQVTRRVESEAHDLETRTAELEARLQSALDATLAPVSSALEAGDLYALFAHLGVSPGDPRDSVTVGAACCDIEIPIQRCERPRCPADRDFERHFEESWAGTPHVGILPSLGTLAYLPDYRPGELNQLVANMLADPITPYDCDAVWICWDTAVRTYGATMAAEAAAAADSDPANDFHYDLLDSFLTCAGRPLLSRPGRPMRGFVDRPWGTGFDAASAGYLSHAYAYFRYTAGDSPACESASGGTPPDWSAFDTEDWERFYRCVRNQRAPGSPEESAIRGRFTDASGRPSSEAVEAACRTVVESRFPGFVSSVERLYGEHDCTIDSSNDWHTVYCSAQRLIDHFLESCRLSLVTDPDDPTRVRRVGSDAEIERMTRAMTYGYTLAVPIGAAGGSCGHVADLPSQPAPGETQCPEGFEPVDGGVSHRDLLLSYLDYELRRARGIAGTGSGSFDTGRTLGRPGSPFAGEVASRCTKIVPFRADDGLSFEIDDRGFLVFGDTAVCDPGGGSLNCPALCLRWNEPVVPPGRPITPVSCEEQATDFVRDRVLEQSAACVERQRSRLRDRYRKTCLAAGAVDDRLTLSYELGYYHFTLFYYDRAGNLVRTVPPAGVDLTSTTRADHPAHTFVSEYEHDSQGRRIEQTTPDAARTTHAFDRAGRPRFSQDARQQAAGAYAYVKYDRLGRAIETGESNEPRPSGAADDRDFPSRERREVVRTVYSEPAPGAGLAQRFLQGRVSRTETDAGAATTFSYDPHGHVEWLAQTVPGLPAKIVEYEHDAVTGNVTAVRFQPGEPDQLLHRYAYDAERRLTRVETSRDGWIWDRDARYDYSAHGPLRRMVLGEDGVQGVDFIYTLRGALKGINHPSLDPARDPGGDGRAAGADAFGEELTYFDGDFERPGSPFESGVSDHLAAGRDLFDGGIAAVSSRVRLDAPPSTGSRAGFRYRYDEAGRLTASAFAAFDGAWSERSDYATGYTYDGNGSLLTLSRNGLADRGPEMDRLTYVYPPSSRRLRHVTDTVAADRYATDVDSQPADNYAYDAAGRMVRDAAAGIDRIDWTADGRVQRVTMADGDVVEYLYGPNRHRVAATVRPASGGAETTFYVRGAEGVLLALYTQDGGAPRQDEILIRGTDRIGVLRPPAVEPAATPRVYTRRLGRKTYELADHLGSVRATVSDVKQPAPGGGFTADIRSWSDRYPFGSPLPGREGAAGSHRFGFDGMEKEDRIDPSGALYTTTFRMLDTRLARWWSVDPQLLQPPDVKSPGLSVPHAYSFAEGNPARFTDPAGDRIVIRFQEGGHTRELEYEPGNADQLINTSDNPFVFDTLMALEELRLNNGPVGRSVIEGLVVNSHEIGIEELQADAHGSYRDAYGGDGRTVRWTRTGLIVVDRQGRVVGRQSPLLVLIHELGHAYDDVVLPHTGEDRLVDWEGNPSIPTSFITPDPQYDYVGERWATEMVENPVARRRGETVRTNHRGIPYATPCTVCTEAASAEEERLIREAIRTGRRAEELRGDLMRLRGHYGLALGDPREP